MSGIAGKRVLIVGGCGYIGSFLAQKLIEAGAVVKICDVLLRGNPAGFSVIEADYISLEAESLADLDAVLWFAGHSSVGQSMADPIGAVYNNCLNLFEFARRLPESVRFVYASSASLYSTQSERPEPADELALTNIPGENHYDISKFAFDYLATHFLNNFYAMRMGTLAGYSPNVRPELVFNAMNISAFQQGRVVLRNGGSWRSILILEDLWFFLAAVLRGEVRPGFFNASSFSMRMGDLAKSIASVWGASVEDMGDDRTYSFVLDPTKFCQYLPSDKPRSLADECQDFVRQYCD